MANEQPDPGAQDLGPLTLNVRALDDDHLRLFRRLTAFIEAIGSSTQREAQAKAANDFLQFTMHHFETEERLMEGTAYPEQSRHADQHSLLIRILMDWWRRFLTRGEYDVSDEDRAFLAEWISEHIDTEDRWLAEHLRNLGYE